LGGFWSDFWRPGESIGVCRDDPAALDAIDRVMARGPGNADGNNQYTSGTVDNINNSKKGNERPTGTSRAAALRRLRKHRPDLHEQVIKGDKTANGALVEAVATSPLSNSGIFWDGSI